MMGVATGGPRTSAVAAPLARGAIVAGRFQIVRELGSGGMGVVYDALDLRRGVRVALKAPHPTAAPEAARLKDEFRCLTDLAHDGVVRPRGLVGDGAQWFGAMELVDGEGFV